jgi:hypothetical protein
MKSKGRFTTEATEEHRGSQFKTNRRGRRDGRIAQSHNPNLATDAADKTDKRRLTAGDKNSSRPGKKFDC